MNLITLLSQRIIYLPVIVGFLRIKCLEKDYLYLCFFLFFAGIFQDISYFLSKDLHVKVVLQYIWYAVSTILLFKWILELYITRIHWFKIILPIISLVCVDYLYQFDKMIKTPWFYLFSRIIITVLLISLLAKEFTNSKKITKSSKLFIYIPFIFTNALFIYLQLFYFFYYTASTQTLLVNTHNIYLIVCIISYLSYTFAFLCAPRKQQYLP